VSYYTFSSTASKNTESPHPLGHISDCEVKRSFAWLGALPAPLGNKFAEEKTSASNLSILVDGEHTLHSSWQHH
jgi:hypothetical protein